MIGRSARFCAGPGPGVEDLLQHRARLRVEERRFQQVEQDGDLVFLDMISNFLRILHRSASVSL